MMNGMMVCCCNMTMGMCKCEMTEDGVCITCTSGDPPAAHDPGLLRLHGFHVKAGCVCCMCMNNMPVCCSC